MKRWKTISRVKVLDERPWLVVERHAIRLHDGRVIRNWHWVTMPDYVNVVAVTDKGRFLCFRQGKYGLKGASLAPVGGFIDKGERPLAAAKRELLEETGFAAAKWHKFGSFRVDPNRGIAMGHFYLALDAHSVAEPIGGDLEEQELLHLTRAQVEKALSRGQFKVLAWASSMIMALRKIGR